MDTTPDQTAPGALTDLELEALTATAIGLPQDQAARSMGMCPRTFRRLLANAAAKLDADGPVHAAVLAAFDGLLDPARVRGRAAPTGYRPAPHLVRAWATVSGIPCSPSGRVPNWVYARYETEVLGRPQRGQS